MADRVKIERTGSVVEVQLHRPEKLNALDAGMFSDLSAAARELAADRSVRAIVLSGAGRAFCAGLDFASFLSMGEIVSSGGGLLRPVEGVVGNVVQRAGLDWYEMPVPVIAALHGVVFGGGLQIALGADIRIVDPDARLSIMEIKWGLIPDMSGTQTLRRLVRLDVAKELTFTGRIVSGTEAVELGLATRVAVEPREAALALAQEIATKSPDAIRRGKVLLNESGLCTVEEGLALEERLQLELIGSPNQLEAVQAALAKRPGEFLDPE